MKGLLQVKRMERLTPNYVRIVLEGNDLVKFREARAGDNNKLLIPPAPEVEFELPDSPREKGEGFVIRTYTLRKLDFEKGEMLVDFVMHGDNGPASLWASRAQPGHKIGVYMKVKTKPLFQKADSYLLIGDHTALPVISVILEDLPATATGRAVLEVHSEEDKLHLKKPAGMEIKWVINSNPEDGSVLAESVKAYNIHNGIHWFVMAAAEYRTIKVIQEFLKNSSAIERKQWYAYSYWKSGVAEDTSATDRRDLSIS
ncbi:siderophore-interacting protein [Robertkochia solimangrovi]|uniref:siderophore-interacting protein n=1 Tax=Robertkochia solimangrovi TaxID=2213046 RepID=UPI0013A56E09|nr:siderophore-interacting protein [Robertkochia solimangrovi]